MQVGQFTVAKGKTLSCQSGFFFFLPRAVESRNEPFSENSAGPDLKLTVALNKSCISNMQKGVLESYSLEMLAMES